MSCKRVISSTIASVAVGIPLLLAFTNCSQGGFAISENLAGDSSESLSEFLKSRTYDSSFGEYSALYLKTDQAGQNPLAQKLRMEKNTEDLSCELIGDFNLKTHYRAGVGPQIGGTDPLVYENSRLHQQYFGGDYYIPLYVGQTISFNSYIGNRYETDSAVSAEQAKQTASLLCGSRVKKVSFIQSKADMSAFSNIYDSLDEGAPYYQILHGIVFRQNLFTVVVPPFWSPKTNKYPVLVNGFYSLNNNAFHALGEGQNIFRLQRRLIDDGQRGFVGVMWNGGGAVGSRTMSDLAYRDFNDFIGLVSQDLGLDANKGVSFGISRGGITALNLAAHPAVKNLRFAYVNAAAPPMDAGYIAELLTPTIPALLFANDWSTGYLGSWRNSFRMQAGNSGISQHLQNIVGTDNKSVIGSQYSAISPERINKLKANQTAVFMELSSHDIIVPFADQLRGLNKMIEQQVKVEGRINYLLGHQEDEAAKFERIYQVLLALSKNQPVPTSTSGFIDRKVLVEDPHRNKVFASASLGYAGVPLTIEVPRFVVPEAPFQVIVTGTPGRRYVIAAQDNGSAVPKTLDFTVSASGINVINLQYGDVSGSELYIDDIYEVDSSGTAQYRLQTRSSFLGSNQKLKISKLQSSYSGVPHFHGFVVNAYLGDNCKNCLLNGEFNSYGLLEVNRAPASESEKQNLKTYLDARCAKGEFYENGVCRKNSVVALDPNVAKCAAGSTTVSSADGKASCSFSWSEASVGAASMTKVLSGNLSVQGTCEVVNNATTWKWKYNCASTNQVTCAGGQHIVKSPSGLTTCAFPYSPKLPGETQTVISATGNGQAKGLCLDDGRWQFTASCSDPGVVSCPAGEERVGKKCWFIWETAKPGETPTVTDLNGTGSTFRGTCGADGVWKNVSLPINRCE